MSVKLRKPLESITYSVLLIIIIHFLFFRLAPQIFIIAGAIPLLFVGNIIRFKYFVITTLIVDLIFFLIFSFELKFLGLLVSIQFLINFLIISSLSLVFIFLLKLKRKNILDNNKVILFFIFFILITEILFNYFYFYKLEHTELREFLLNFSKSFFEKQSPENNLINQSFIESVIKIIPAINSFFLAMFFFLNSSIANHFVSQLNFKNIYQLKYSEFISPSWFFLLLNILVFLSIMTTGELKFFLINTCIIMSFLIFFQGFIYFYNIFTNLEISLILKIIITFLLFLFLGYVLFLIIFFMGYYLNLKALLKN